MRVHFSASIIEGHSNPLTVHCAYSDSTHSEEGPEYQNLAMVLTVLELWPCTATGPEQGLRERERDMALTQHLLARKGK